MKTTFKKVFAAVLAVASLSVCSIGITSHASSGFNYFSNFSVDTSNGSWRSLPPNYPSKDSPDDVYLYLNKASVTNHVRVLGCSNSTGSTGGNCTLDANGNPTDHVSVSYRQPSNIKNNVRDYYNYCTLSFRSSSSQSGDYISGSWITY